MWRQGQGDAARGRQVWVGVCARLFPSHRLVTYPLVCLSSACRARSQSRRRKHVLSLMTECQDCPCWGKEACQRAPPSSDDRIGRGQTSAEWPSSGRTLTFVEAPRAKTTRLWEFKLFCLLASVGLTRPVVAGTQLEQSSKGRWTKRNVTDMRRACDGLPWIHEWRGMRGEAIDGSKVQVTACFIQFYSGLCGQVHSAARCNK